jgi:tetratricopeptide (TPR) repeat protein
LSGENPHLLEDNILFLILIGKRNFHTYILSDQEANRCKATFKSLIANHPDDDCHEAFFGLAKIYFHLNRLDAAYECIAKATRMRSNDKIYVLWKGLILFYIVSYGNLSNSGTKADFTGLQDEDLQKLKK